MNTTILVAGLTAFAVILLTPAGAAPEDDRAREILEATKVSGGFVVHLGCGDGSLTAALRASENFIVHGLDRDPSQVARARETIRKAGSYGSVSIEELQGDRLPYLNELANLVVAEDRQGIAEAEILRVLRPGGSSYLKTDGKWVLTRKPWPGNIDDWSHYLHDAGGNTVAHDTVVGPPRHMKWVGSPRWSRHHDRMASMSALVSDAGRLFYIMDEGSRISIQMPPKWELVARDAFNGVVLWKRPIPDWHSHLWPLKSGPTQLARRLVAVDDHVFATLGIKAPVSMIDAASGATVREFEGSHGTEELIVSGSTLFVSSYKEKTELEAYRPEAGRVGDQAKVAARYKWDELPRVIMAFDTSSGDQLWTHVSRVSPLTICSDGERLYYYDGDKVVARDGQSGEQVWNGGETDRRKKMTINFGPKLVVEQGQVFFAGGDRKMHVYNAETGEELWNAPHARGGYQSPEDLIIMKGMVWSAPLTSGRDSGTFTGRDIHTGEVVKEFTPDVDTYWFHHRCYIAKATDRFLIPSRTGIEFVDPEAETWDINHWVRGGCLYGVMPANGLTYAPPHNCACYPETKLYGFNALSSYGPSHDFNSGRLVPNRLTRGPAYGEVLGSESGVRDWPTYRGDSSRSGYTAQPVGPNVDTAWDTKLGGRLSAPTAAAGLVFVAQVDQHTVHALDSKTGGPVWSFTAGGRVDSPPTYYRGALLFGSSDGNVYCLRADDGVLAWKFKAAPGIERHMAFEQLESVWPVHGSILVENDQAYFVAGRSNFLDGGLRFYRLNPLTGAVLAENAIDHINPATGENIQDKIATLQMPSGLPDILSYDGGYVYMRSQRLDSDGNRHDIGPHSGDAATQGAVQREGEHLFAPMSYLDDTYFHRAYWVFGKSFAGGHNGYYQAGKNTPSGRLLVADSENVYGFGRKPEYLRWTTTIEHQLFAASRRAPGGALTTASVLEKSGRRTRNKKTGGSMLRFTSAKSITPVGKPLGVEAWVKMTGKNGVILAHGGPAEGYALVVRGSKPRFCYRAGDVLSTAIGKSGLADDWNHLVGQVTVDKKLQLYLNGKLIAEGETKAFIGKEPAQSLEIGSDDGSAVGEYKSPLAVKAIIDEVTVFHGSLTSSEVMARFEHGPSAPAPADATPILVCSFDDGTANDRSGYGNHGINDGAKPNANGKFGKAMQFTGKSGGGNQQAGTLVKHKWTGDIPIYARAMMLAGQTLFVAGPPDLIDEEETFAKLAEGDEEVQKLLARQDAALNGAEGGVLWAVSASDGKQAAEIKLDALPVWDGMIGAGGMLVVSTMDGRVLALK